MRRQGRCQQDTERVGGSRSARDLLRTAFCALLCLALLGAPAVGQSLTSLANSSDDNFSAVGLGLPERPSRRAVQLDATVRVGHTSAAAWLGSLGLSLDQLQATASDAATLSSSSDFLGGDFAISSHVEAVSPTEDLDAASIAYNPARGEYLVVWHALLRETAINIYGRRLSASGVPIGNPFVISEAPGVQAVPHVAYEASADTYWVTWTDFRTGEVPDVMIRRVSGTGQLLGSEITVNGPVNDAFASRIACGSGRCVVTWQNAEPDGDSHILIQGYEASGTTFSPILLLTDVTGVVAEPDICFNPTDGHFAVAWQKANGSHWDVWMFRLTRDLAGLGRNAVSEAAGHQRDVRISYGAGAGRYLLVWQDARSGQSWDIYGQLVDRNGALQGPALAIYSGAYHDVSPVAAGHSSSSEFVVSFQRDISGAQQYQIYGARVTGGGSIGQSFPIRIWYNIRFTPTLLHRANTSEYIAAWTDFGTAIQNDIQAQRFSSNGTMSGNLINVSVGRKGQETPATAYNTFRNEYLTVWADYRSGDDYDLYARRVSPSGALLGQEFVVASIAFLYGLPEIAYDPYVDEYLVVWAEITSPQTGYEIYARRVSGLGILGGSAFHISRDTNTVNEGVPVVAFNPIAREYLVAWHAFTNSRWQIWGQFVSEPGQLVGGNFIVSGGDGDTQAPRIVHNPTRNEYVLVWLDWRNNRGDVYGQRLTGSGARTGDDLAISTATGNKGRCDLDYNATDATYLVAWGDTRTGNSDIYGQMLDAGANLSGPNFPISASEFSEFAPLVGWDPVSGDFLLVWWEFHSATDYDVWAATVSGTGTVAGDWLPVTEALEVQRAAKLSRGATNGTVLVVWQDFRNANYDIYGRLWKATAANKTLTVTKAGAGSGTVTSSPTGISCGSNCSAEFTQGTVVTLTATPVSGSTFAGWGGSCSGAGACTVTLDNDATVMATFNATGAGNCSPSSTVLCLPADNRFRVSVAYSTTQGGGISGDSPALPLDSLGLSSGGLFYFNNPTDPQFLVKVINGCAINDRFWVFYAATTNVGFTMTVTDTLTSQNVYYVNPDRNTAVPVTDTQAFATCSQSAALVAGGDPIQSDAASALKSAARFQQQVGELLSGGADSVVPVGLTEKRSVVLPIASNCVPSSTTLCLPSDNRFRVSVAYSTTQGGGISGDSQATPLDSLGLTSGGLFYFNNPTDPQFLVKVINGCGLNNRFWVFYAATTNVGFTMTVTDTLTGESIDYVNADRNTAVPVTDTGAFATCP